MAVFIIKILSTDITHIDIFFLLFLFLLETTSLNHRLRSIVEKLVRRYLRGECRLLARGSGRGAGAGGGAKGGGELQKRGYLRGINIPASSSTERNSRFED